MYKEIRSGAFLERYLRRVWISRLYIGEKSNGHHGGHPRCDWGDVSLENVVFDQNCSCFCRLVSARNFRGTVVYCITGGVLVFAILEPTLNLVIVVWVQPHITLQCNSISRANHRGFVVTHFYGRTCYAWFLECVQVSMDNYS